MNAANWTRKVFRLRKVPQDSASSPIKAAILLAEALDIPLDHIIIYSLAVTSDIWESPPSKVATLQLKSVPKCLQEKMMENQWLIPLPEAAPHQNLLLDTHFEGLAALNDVEPENHNAECVGPSPLSSKDPH
jgi:hypothetical protein